MTTDPYNFILNEVVIPQSGKQAGTTQLKQIGYYSSIPQLIEGMISKKLLKGKCRSLKGLIQEHNDLVCEIKSLFRKLKKEDLYVPEQEKKKESKKK